MNDSSDQLRNQYRQLRADLDDAAQVKAGQSLCDRIKALPEYQQAEHIAVYSAVMGEISLEPLIDHALSCDKKIYLPNLDQKSLRFSPYFREQKMRINRYKLPEPDVTDDEMLAPEELELVLAPLVVFDAGRNRIGMGGGFYDRSFAFRKDPDRKTPILIGIAHELQKVDRLEPEAWDVQLDMVATDQAVYN